MNYNTNELIEMIVKIDELEKKIDQIGEELKAYE